MTDEVSTRVTTALTADETAQALTVIDAATKADGQPPLSEHVLFHVRAGGGEHSHHVLATQDGVLAGYGHLGLAHFHPPVLELAVHPDHRRHLVVARAIVNAARAKAAGPMHVWAHGEAAPTAAIGALLGFVEVRMIWQMRRSLTDPLPDAPLPDGFALRTFLPGIDDADLLAVNARAFAAHPEQGDWTAADLQQRLDEPWFDATGLLIAEHTETGRIAGFHWTKVLAGAHGGPSNQVHRHAALGEVYVVGVDPDFAGKGLGKALTVAGLAYLRDRSLDEAHLYVDESNTAAIALYESIGFTRHDTDLLFTAP